MRAPGNTDKRHYHYKGGAKYDKYKLSNGTPEQPSGGEVYDIGFWYKIGLRQRLFVWKLDGWVLSPNDEEETDRIIKRILKHRNHP